MHLEFLLEFSWKFFRNWNFFCNLLGIHSKILLDLLFKFSRNFCWNSLVHYSGIPLSFFWNSRGVSSSIFQEVSPEMSSGVSPGIYSREPEFNLELMQSYHQVYFFRSCSSSRGSRHFTSDFPWSFTWDSCRRFICDSKSFLHKFHSGFVLRIPLGFL